MEKAYKFRLYPNKPQRDQISLNIEVSRWVFNKCLEMRINAYKAGEKSPSKYDLAKAIRRMRTEHPWLNQADCKVIETAAADLDSAYQHFFRRVKQGTGKPGFPRFKSRKTARRSYRTRFSGQSGVGGVGSIQVLDDRHVKLPKMGSVRCKIHRMPEGRILSATISEEPSGRYYVSILCTDVPEPSMPQGKLDVIGIDAGVHDLMVRSDGVRVPNPKRLDKALRQLRREQRRLSRRQKGSSNYERQRLRVARVHERVTNARRDLINKATTDVVRDCRLVATEDLNVKGMVRNHHLARAIADASMGEALRELEYKCDWYGRGFVKVGRFYPSSKTCSHCGHVYKDLTLSQRSWTCPGCGERVDRDLNAAVNIAREGKRILDGTVGLTGTGADAPTLVEQA